MSGSRGATLTADAKVRDDLLSGAQIAHVTSRVGADGKTYDVVDKDFGWISDGVSAIDSSAVIEDG